MICVVVYDNEMKKRAYLENAFNIGYEKKLNELWTASFSLPATDPKNAECEPLRYVEIFDSDGKRVELFRILPTTLSKADTTTVTYQCEHVLATLIDDVLFQYHEIGGVGVYTETILEYILSRQTSPKWTLGDVEFKRQFLYKWENENLLGSLFSVPKPFLEPYMWTWDTTVFPWKLNLVAIKDDVESYVRYKKNLKGIEKYEDPTQLCTRLYCLGYGEGVNQLTIEEVNNGKPYLDAPTINQYGVIARIYTDRRFEDAESLKATGQAILNELQVPRLEYEIQGADLHSITQDPVDKFQVGTYTRVIDTELNMNVKALVVSLSKSDITGNPGDITIGIANKPQDIATSIAELADRQRINEVYAQGATNLDSYNFMDNCDPNYPAVLKFYVPEETVRINKMTLSYETSAFRAYSKAIEGGGAYADTTSEGGGYSDTTEAGGGAVKSTEAGGGALSTTGAGGGSVSTTNVQLLLAGIAYNDSPLISGRHNHGIPNGTVLMTSAGTGVAYVESGDHTHEVYKHGHEVIIPQHNHFVDIPKHSHGFEVPDHKHRVQIPTHNHRITLPDHIHEIEYGIFEAPIWPSEVLVTIDGKPIPGLGTSEVDINIIPYLAKDGGGRVQRGWHEIKITPNKLGRITANVVTQLFVQSRGGGNY